MDSTQPSAMDQSRAMAQPVFSSSGRSVTKDPPMFDGDPTIFKEWSFAVTLSLRGRKLSKAEELEYAASYLVRNARLWLITAMEAGTGFADWPELKNALAQVYGPHFNEEQVRLQLFSVKCRFSMDTYISEFSMLNLQIPELDDHSWTCLFVNGPAKSQVLKEHPRTPAAAIQAALMVQQDGQRGQFSTPEQRGQFSIPLQKLTPADRQQLMQQHACFRCRHVNHLARDCPANSHLNGAGQ